MLQELGNGLKQVALAGVGAVAIAAEKLPVIVKDLAKKGEATVEQGKALNEELKRKCQAQRGSQCHCTGTQHDCAQSSLDVSKLTPEQRAALKQQLEALENDQNHESGCAE